MRITSTSINNIIDADSNRIISVVGGASLTPSFTSSPVVSGLSPVGSLLTTTNGTVSGVEPITYSYDWKRNGVSIGAADQDTYTTVGADEGNTITVTVTATNAFGNSSSTSNGVGVGTIPLFTVDPVLTGDGGVGDLLTVTNGTVTGTATITYSYDWLRDTVSIGATDQNTYTTVMADEGTEITCEVTATNFLGDDDATSNAIEITSFNAVTTSQLGTNSVGSSDLDINDEDYIFKKISMTAGQVLTDVSTHITTSNTGSSGSCYLYSDDTGSPDKIIGMGYTYAGASPVNQISWLASRFVSWKLHYHAKANIDIWLAFFRGHDNEEITIKYETTGGTDQTLAASNVNVADITGSPVVQTYDISIFANVQSTVSVSDLGTNTTAATTDYAVGQNVYIYKKITLSAGQLLKGINVHMETSGDGSGVPLLLSDNGGSPDKIVGITSATGTNGAQYELIGKRWISYPVSYYSAAGEDLWIAMFGADDSVPFTLSHKATGGTDRIDTDASSFTFTDVGTLDTASFEDFSMYVTAFDLVNASPVGTTSEGVSDLVIGQNDYIYKKITLSAGQTIENVVVYLETVGAGSGHPVIFSDNAGEPDIVLALMNTAGDIPNQYDLSGKRWVSYPISYHSAAGEDVWIAMFGSADVTPFTIAYETTGGTDFTRNTATDSVRDADTPTAEVFNISMFANVTG